MDVRAADTTSLAAKRVELEKTQPVTRKQRVEVDELLIASEVARTEDEGPQNQQPGQNDGETGAREDSVLMDQDSPSQDADGVHILDVKV